MIIFADGTHFFLTADGRLQALKYYLETKLNYEINED